VAVQATDATGSPAAAKVTATYAPARFAIALPGANAPYVAGKEFTAVVTALNAATPPAATPNFGREMAPESAKLAAIACQPATGYGLLSQTSPTLAGGVQTFKATWSETGRIDVTAQLSNKTYLGSSLAVGGASTSTVPPGCSGTVGTFVPAYFGFDVDTGWQRRATLSGSSSLQYYSGEPSAKLTVTAYSLLNSVTKNYAGTYARDVLFTGLNPDGTPLPPAGTNPDGSPIPLGVFSRSPGYPAADLTGKAQLRAADFVDGVATWTGSYTFTKTPTGQTLLRVRATEDLPAAQSPVSSSAIPAAVTTGTEPTLLIRSGRIRFPSRFGPAGSTLKFPVTVEYYTGQTWMPNAEDSTTVLPAGIVSTLATGPTVTSTLSPKFTGGKAELTMTPSIAAHVSVPFALNLGTTTANTSCYAGKGMTASTGGALAFLRSPDASCATAGSVDPSALATFGVYAPETKRIIHTREVFR
jgi:MSHA biogenesis protein MshQ